MPPNPQASPVSVPPLVTADLAPEPPPASKSALQAPHSPSVRLGVAAWWLGLSGVLVAGASAYGLSVWLGPTSHWSAALGAALGLLVAAAPLLVLLRRLGWGLAGTGPHVGLQGRLMDTQGDALAPVGIDRELFLNLAEREWARARRYGSGAALLWVDVDRYTRLCEARGTAAGEAVVMQLLLKTAPTLRPADLITRLRHGRTGRGRTHPRTR
jgi:diguanylate cyclase